MTKTDDALTSQSSLLNQFAAIIRGLIQRAVTAETDRDTFKSDRDKALAQVGELLGADSVTAAAILADQPHIQALIDEAAASSLPEPTVPLVAS
ncbi:MAG: hypothetical protein ACYT04_78240 [Nostoc sp.]